MARDYKERFVPLAQTLAKNGVRVGAVSCDGEVALCRRELGGGFNPRRLPLFAVITSAGTSVFEDENEGSATPPPAPKKLYDFVAQSIPQEVHNLRLVPQLEEFISSKCADKRQASYGVGFVLVTAKFETSLFIKTLAHAVSGKAAVAEIRGSNNLLAKELGLGNQPNLPVLLVVCAGSDKLASLTYTGSDMKDQDKVTAWLESKFGKGRGASTCKGLQQKSVEARKARAKRQEGVKRLSMAELRRRKVKELREMAEDMGIPAAGLVEKDDYVAAIAAKVGIRVEL